MTTTAPEGRYALDVNNSAYADPYIFGTPYLPSKADAEALADDLIPVVNDAAKWAIVARAVEELPHAVENAAKGWVSGDTWEQYKVSPGDFLTLLKRVAEDPGPSTETDWRTYCSVTSEARDHSWHPAERADPDEADGCSPVYEENYGGV